MPLIQATVLVSAQSSEGSQEIVMASDAMAEVVETTVEAAAEPAADAAESAVETAAEDTTPEKKGWRERVRRPRGRPPQNRPAGGGGGGGVVYGLGLIGAMVYFFRAAQTPQDYALAVPKAVVWPALLVYKLLKSFYG
jgi:hypothetical protein